MTAQTFYLPPFSVLVDGVEWTILESVKQPIISGEMYYRVVVYVNYKGVKSKAFSLFVKDEKDLLNKLKVETTKIKFMDYSYGLEYVKKVIT